MLEVFIVEFFSVINNHEDIDHLIGGVEIIVGLFEYSWAVTKSVYDMLLGWKIVFDYLLQ